MKPKEKLLVKGVERGDGYQWRVELIRLDVAQGYGVFIEGLSER